MRDFITIQFKFGVLEITAYKKESDTKIEYLNIYSFITKEVTDIKTECKPLNIEDLIPILEEYYDQYGDIVGLTINNKDYNLDINSNETDFYNLALVIMDNVYGV